MSAVSVAVVGAGPHSLTLCAHLLDRYPELRDDIVVLDPSGAWLAAWDRRFAALDIPFLRSPVVHHPDPDPYALAMFGAGRAGFDGQYATPSTAIFREFCHHIADRYRVGELVRSEVVGSLTDGRQGLRLETDAGCWSARVAVVATNPGRRSIPRWAQHKGLRHSDQIDLRTEPCEGRTILVIGGGLTAAHLALGVARRGGRAVVVTRHPRRVQSFDTDPGWLGPKYMEGFWREDWAVRRALVREARGGGSIPPRYVRELDDLAAAGKIDWRIGVVKACHPTSRGLKVHTDDHGAFAVDDLWLATGWRYDASRVALLAQTRRNHPIRVLGGLPTLDHDLAWPTSDVFLMGALAALQVGPTALNLIGARQASYRITSAIGRRLGLGSGCERWKDRRSVRTRVEARAGS